MSMIEKLVQKTVQQTVTAMLRAGGSSVSSGEGEKPELPEEAAKTEETGTAKTAENLLRKPKNPAAGKDQSVEPAKEGAQVEKDKHVEQLTGSLLEKAPESDEERVDSEKTAESDEQPESFLQGVD